VAPSFSSRLQRLGVGSVTDSMAVMRVLSALGNIRTSILKIACVFALK
jgi:hypothetical protein